MLNHPGDFSETLKQANLLNRAEKIFSLRRQRNAQLMHVGKENYLKLFFRYALSHEEFTYAFCDRTELDTLVRELNQLPPYTPARKDPTLQPYLIDFVSLKRADTIHRQLNDFNQFIEEISGHDTFRRLRETPEAMLQDQFRSDTELIWIAAQVLHETGVCVIANREAAYGMGKILRDASLVDYSGWLTFLCGNSQRSISDDHRRCDFYSRFIAWQAKPTFHRFPVLPTAPADSCREVLLRTKNQLTAGENTGDEAALIEYICDTLGSDLYAGLLLEEPEKLSRIAAAAENGFRNWEITPLNRDYVCLLRAFNQLTVFNPAGQKNIADTIGPITGHYQLYRAVAEHICHEKQEISVVVVLNTKNVIIHIKRISAGTVNSVDFDPRLVFGPALQLAASGIALVHNHPSGDPSPSAADERVTKRLSDAAAMLSLRFLDHIIIGADSYYSLVSQSFHKVPASSKKSENPNLSDTDSDTA